MGKAVKFVSNSPRFQKVMHQFVERDLKTGKPTKFHELVFQKDPATDLGVLVLDSEDNKHLIKLIEEEIDKKLGEGSKASDFKMNVRKFDKKRDVPVATQNEMKAAVLEKAATNLQQMGYVLDPDTGEIKQIPKH